MPRIKFVFNKFSVEVPLNLALKFPKIQYLMLSDPLIKSIKINNDIEAKDFDIALHVLEKSGVLPDVFKDFFDYPTDFTYVDENSSNTLQASLQNLITRKINIDFEEALDQLANKKNLDECIVVVARNLYKVTGSAHTKFCNLPPEIIIKVFNSDITVVSEDKLVDMIEDTLLVCGEKVADIITSIKPKYLSQAYMSKYIELVEKYNLMSKTHQHLIEMSQLTTKPKTNIARFLYNKTSRSKVFDGPIVGVLYHYKDFAEVRSDSGIFATPDYPHPAFIINNKSDMQWLSRDNPEESIYVSFQNITVDVTGYMIRTHSGPSFPLHFDFACSVDGEEYTIFDERHMDKMEPDKIYKFTKDNVFKNARFFRWRMIGPNSTNDNVFILRGIDVFGTATI